MSGTLVKHNGDGGRGKTATNIWQIMNYQVPRGKCVHKVSVISSCPCLRFMLNPLQAASSFACDGCGHHASFHMLRNPGEEPEEIAVNGGGTGTALNGKGRKRPAGTGRRVEEEEEEELDDAERGGKRVRS
ncbi:hypothetical protein RUND412_001865 [Rhizina undulata]